mmetsp:Transcript_7004/g.22457  ORF Transcript_7004/g.22457 Transcript_7004/m.22457 type:complete len:202 (+) Transcript_7004:182-787(+)
MRHRLARDLLPDVVLVLERLACAGQPVECTGGDGLLNPALDDIVLPHPRAGSARRLPRLLRLLRQPVAEGALHAALEAHGGCGALALVHGPCPDPLVRQVVALRGARPLGRRQQLLAVRILLREVVRQAPREAVRDLRQQRLVGKLDAPVAAAAVLGEHLHEHVAAVELVVHLELARRERAQLLRCERAVARAHQRLARSL